MPFKFYLTAVSIVCTSCLFLYGFFPLMNTSCNGKSSLNNLPRQIDSYNPETPPLILNSEELYTPRVQKLVLMIIDGLRYDFVSEINMKYTTDQIKLNECCFKVEVNSPTVTMPRLKTLMTGTVSKYIDVILNLGATQISDDNLISQLKENKLRTVFYGDDTWLKLFPAESFLRFEGTSSFYVNDYTDVDDNVTRNVVNELNNMNGWDVMILHYLGLDHIGHISNSFSPLINEKLKEMDSIVQIINEKLIEWTRKNQIVNKRNENFLFIITGDHGMKDMGGHGGATKSETIVPLVTFGNDCRNKANKKRTKNDTKLNESEHSSSENSVESNQRNLFQIETNFGKEIRTRISINEKVARFELCTEKVISQVDITPTLSVLLGIPIPTSNIGKLIPNLLQNLTFSELLYAYLYNSKQIIDNYHENENKFAQVFSNHLHLLRSKFTSKDLLRETISSYSNLLSNISSQIIKLSTNINMFVVILSLIMSMFGTLLVCLDTKICLFSCSTLISFCVLLFVNRSYFHFVINIFISYLLSIKINNVLLGIKDKVQNKIQTSSYFSQECHNNLNENFILEVQTINAVNLSKVELVRSMFHWANLKNNNISLIVLLTCISTLSSLSTSFIENEHNVWLFILNTFLFYTLINSKCKTYEKIQIMFVLVVHRLLRNINMKWLDEDEKESRTLSYWFQINNENYLTSFTIFSFVCVYILCLIIENTEFYKFNAQTIMRTQTNDNLNTTENKNDQSIFFERNKDTKKTVYKYTKRYKIFTVLYNILIPINIVSSFLFKMSSFNLFIRFIPKTYIFNTFITSLITLLLFKVFEFLYLKLKIRNQWYQQKLQLNDIENINFNCLIFKSFLIVTILISIVLLKPYNIILVPISCITSYTVSHIFMNSFFVSTVLHIWLMRLYYFLQGSTNSIANVDITVGYIGQTEYSLTIAGLVVFFNMYVLNLILLLFYFYSIQCQKMKRAMSNISQLNSKHYLSISMKIFFTFIYLNFTFYLFNIYFQRQHLFIWSVFSPKLLLLISFNIFNIVILLLLFILLS